MKTVDFPRLTAFHWLPVIALTILYLHWMSPTVYWGESPLLTLASQDPGISHPPGYSFYVNLGHAFVSLFPFGNLGYRINFMTLIFAVCTLIVCMIFFSRFSKNPLAAIIGTVSLGITHGVIASSTSGEVYSLNLLFISIIFCILKKVLDTGFQRYILLLFLFLGLGSVHHLSFLLLLPGIFGVVIYRKMLTLQTLLSGLLFFLTGISVLLFPAIRGTTDPLINWGIPDSVDRFLRLVMATEEAIPSLAHYLTAAGENVGMFWDTFMLLLTQLHPVILIAGIAGFYRIYKVDKPFFIFFVVTSVLFTIAVSVYHTHEKESFYLPATLIITAGLTMFLTELVMRIGTRLHVLWVVLILSVFIFFPLHSLQKERYRFTKHNAWLPLYMAKGLNNSVNDSGIIITTRSDISFLCWYLEYGERYNLHVNTIFQRLLTHPWYHKYIQQHVAGINMPIIEPGTFEDSRYFVHATTHALIRKNIDSYRFYFTEPDSYTEELLDLNPGISIEPTGFLYTPVTLETSLPANLYVLDFICGWLPTDPLSWNILSKWFDDRARNLPRENRGETLKKLLKVKQCLDKTNPFR